jgi:predicted SprT family Zn-dependent metalloprotease
MTPNSPSHHTLSHIDLHVNRTVPREDGPSSASAATFSPIEAEKTAPTSAPEGVDRSPPSVSGVRNLAPHHAPQAAEFGVGNPIPSNLEADNETSSRLENSESRRSQPLLQFDRYGKAIGLDDLLMNGDIAVYQANIADWASCGVGNLGGLARQLRLWADSLWTLICDTVQGPHPTLPTLLVTFDDDHPKVLAHYRRGRNGTGLRFEVSLNPRNIPGSSEADLGARLLHELMHLHDDLLHAGTTSKKGYHGVEFRKRAEALGIPCTQDGKELRRPDSSIFHAWAEASGLSLLPIGSEQQPGESKKPRQSRVTWSCKCDGRAIQKVLVASGTEFRARCEGCQQLFARVQR